MNLSGVIILRDYLKKKKLSQYLVLVAVLVIESKFCVLYFK